QLKPEREAKLKNYPQPKPFRYKLKCGSKFNAIGGSDLHAIQQNNSKKLIAWLERQRNQKVWVSLRWL
ncbi:MAG: hypothetical protein WC742_07410, partial [Gallionellaceae bacterium]